MKQHSQFRNDLDEVIQFFPDLNITQDEHSEFLFGILNLVDSQEVNWGSYQIEIRPSDKYPYCFPRLYETGNQFPKIADWHVNDDNSCCIDVPANELLICQDGLSVLKFIERYAIPYFANQKFRELNGYYLYGEYSHGIIGKLEFYQSKLKARNINEFLEMIDFIINGFNLPRQAMCPFCYKSKFRRCHRTPFKELESIKRYIYHDIKYQVLPFFSKYPSFDLSSIRTHFT